MSRENLIPNSPEFIILARDSAQLPEGGAIKALIEALPHVIRGAGLWIRIRIQFPFWIRIQEGKVQRSIFYILPPPPGRGGGGNAQQDLGLKKLMCQRTT